MGERKENRQALAQVDTLSRKKITGVLETSVSMGAA